MTTKPILSKKEVDLECIRYHTRNTTRKYTHPVIFICILQWCCSLSNQQRRPKSREE